MRFSKAFRLRKAQAELDFVDIDLDRDMPLFVDPFALAQGPDPWSHECHLSLRAFFQAVVDQIRRGDKDRALQLLSNLREPNETRLGLSSGRPRGAGIGRDQALQLYEALASSSAVRTGFITALEESELMVEGIGRDKISDLSTNIVRHQLANYTEAQCDLHGVPTSPVALPPGFDATASRWVSRTVQVPVWRRHPILLVPKTAVRFEPAYEHHAYYRQFVLEYLRAEELRAQSSLVQTLRNHTQVVRIKDLKAKYPLTKEFLFAFSRDHPDVLRRYRQHLAATRSDAVDLEPDPEEAARLAEALSVSLSATPAGQDSADEYHSLMIGVVEFVFSPDLVHPRKEVRIHDGRKRIDIVTENRARANTFFVLHDVRRIPCPYIVIECKNYSEEVGNPEFDQLSGRFSVNRGQVGILCCRAFEDREKAIARCRDTFNDGRGLILPIDDEWVKACLSLIEAGRRGEIDRRLADLVAEVCLG